MNTLKIEWIDAGREAACPPDPAYPDGVNLVDNPEALAHCVTLLPYPAPRCGLWVVRCERCRKSVHITAAGRVDDPRSISMACPTAVLAKEAGHGG